MALAIGFVMFLALAASIQTQAWGTGHPDTCQPCHGQYGTTADTISGTTYNFWNHQLQNGDPVWDNCVLCHTDYTQGTVHATLGCKGCHAVLHIGYYNGTSYAAGLYYWELSNPNYNPIIAPGTVALQKQVLVLDQNNASTYVPNIANYLGTNGMEVEVGVWDAFNNQFLETSGAGVDTPGDAYKVCFSCHFIVDDPASVGSYMIVDGKWKIGIPAAALEMDPHNIHPITPEQTTEESTGGLPLATFSIGALGAALLLFARKY